LLLHAVAVVGSRILVGLARRPLGVNVLAALVVLGVM